MNEPKNFMMNNHTQETKNVLVISDLADNVNEQDLQIFFEDFKDSILVIQYNRSRSDFLGGKSNSATIIFKEYKEADKAKYQLNMRKLKGKTTRITWHERDSTVRYNNQANVYVKNIPLDVTARQFYEYFCTFGDVVSAKLVENEDGNHLGYGYVHYSNPEAKNSCLEASNDKEIWPGSKLTVENFQKKQERTTGNTPMNPNKSIFMKNFPADYDEKKIRDLIGKDVKISWMKVMSDPKDRKYATIILENEEDSVKVKKLNRTEINGQELFVDNLMNKHDRKRYLISKIHDQNMQLTRKFRDCNLHVRNLPSDFKEDDLKKLFGAYGEIKSVKVPTTKIGTKIKGELVEIVTSCCFGYVCFSDPESAKAAFDDMNGKVLEGSKRPLIISYFMSKNERAQAFNQSGFSKKQWDGLNMNNPYMADLMNPKSNMRQFPQQIQKGQPNMNMMMNDLSINNMPVEHHKPLEDKRIDEPDYNLLKNLEDDGSKKDYLGEFIFRKIESHKLSETHNLTMDHIGKITGMILGIEDINEIIDICRSNDHLTSRILEALSLLNA